LLRSCQQTNLNTPLDQIDEIVIANESHQIGDIYEADEPNQIQDIHGEDGLEHIDDNLHHIDQLNHENDIDYTDDLNRMCSFNVNSNAEGANILTEEDMSVESWRRRPKTLQKSRS